MNAEFSITNVTIIEVEPRKAAVVRKRVPPSDMARAQREARRALESALKAQRIDNSGPFLTIWRTPEQGMIDYAPGVFVSDIEETGDVSLYSLPSGRAAHLRLRGPYSALPEAWARLIQQCDGRELAGVNWEVYTSSAGAQSMEIDLYALLA